MPLDYRDAAQRHYEDAEYLLADARLANADHLFGFSAECALKAVMLSLGMQFKQNKIPVEEKYRVHINNLWDEFRDFANNRNGAHYVSMLPGGSNPFATWDVSQRYDHRSDIIETIVGNHRQAAKIVKQVLDSAVSNGGVI
ncbi:MAG: SAM-dependent methyltransferase [Nitrospirae bacterium]|uniref:hypothetical protein n=1 Tax=Candidatus Magnetobacterium casense TaxID=1455061 RepID=UPI000590BB14|nr:hypothetical protein [Candidatus Magnetobacterium casensis]MBF0336645.1 SAM-dependent methyltransferase [Nitrospirota bacterium]